MKMFKNHPIIILILACVLCIPLAVSAGKPKDNKGDKKASAVVEAATPPNLGKLIEAYEDSIEAKKKEIKKASENNRKALETLQPVIYNLEGRIHLLDREIDRLNTYISSLNADLDENLNINRIFLADLNRQRQEALASQQTEIDSLMGLPFSLFPKHIDAIKEYRAQLSAGNRFRDSIDKVIANWEIFNKLKLLLDVEYNAEKANMAMNSLMKMEKQCRPAQKDEITDMGRTFYSYSQICPSFYTLTQEVMLKKEACKQAADDTQRGQYRNDIKKLIDDYKATKYFPYIGKIPYMKNLWEKYVRHAYNPRAVNAEETEVIEILSKYKPQ
ncbi:MAG: hypothetical protein NC097_04520 [Clostridium sp.]|nr:hypothetical protein [Prevotella sp.]MCM1429042.1 hypothetical protein [Clostridium sp.]